METVSNLEKRFYSDPPTSRNSLSYFIPQYFCKLLNNFNIPSFTPTFIEKFIFQLYKDLSPDSALLEVIYSKCEESLSLLLNFYENWNDADKWVNLDMTEGNDEYEKTAKIFLLSNRKRALNANFWFLPEWDLRKSAVIYDPRLTSKDL